MHQPLESSTVTCICISPSCNFKNIRPTNTAITWATHSSSVISKLPAGCVAPSHALVPHLKLLTKHLKGLQNISVGHATKLHGFQLTDTSTLYSSMNLGEQAHAWPALSLLKPNRQPDHTKFHRCNLLFSSNSAT